MVRLHLLTVMVATSYLTLGIFDTKSARDWWLPYALVTLALALAGITDGWRNRNA